jgi:hypothetical protein
MLARWRKMASTARISAVTITQTSEKIPGQAGDDADRPGDREQHAQRGGDALAALEAEPDRERWPSTSEQAATEAASGPTGAIGDQDRDRALAAVEDQRRRGQALAAGAQHVGRADIARADGLRMSPKPAMRVSTSPNGIEPSR